MTAYTERRREEASVLALVIHQPAKLAELFPKPAPPRLPRWWE